MNTPAPALAFKVQGMSCQHCVRAITQAIQRLDAQASVTVDLPGSTVQVASTLSRERVAQAIADEGYAVAP